MTEYRVHVPRPFPVVHFTVPTPRTNAGRYRRDEPCPLTVCTPEGVALPTVAEVVTRRHGGYPAVVELWCETIPRGDLVVRPRASDDPPPERTRPLLGDTAAAAITRAPTFRWRRGVAGGPIGAETNDEHTVWGAYHRRNPFCVTRQFHSDHVTGFVTVVHGTDCALYEVRVHNGTPTFLAQNKSTGWPVVFSELAMVKPQPGADFIGLVEETAKGSWQTEDEFILVGNRAGGLYHCLVRRGQAEFRFAAGNAHDANALVGDYGLAFCPGAYQDPENCGWSIAGLPAPIVPGNWIAFAGAQCGARASQAIQAFNDRTQIGVGSKPGQAGGAIDWLQVWGSDYGGITSGGERDLVDGLEELLSASVDGVAALKMRGIATSQRDPVALFGEDGEPVAFHDVTDASGSRQPFGSWRMSAVDGQFHNKGSQDGIFGWSNRGALPVPVEQIAEYDHLDLYDGDGRKPNDFQHYVRSWSFRVALVYLCNDPLSRQSVMLYAELWGMAWRCNYINEYWDALGNRLKGTPAGRAQAHGWQAMAAAYAMGPREFRLRWREDASKFLDFLAMAQQPNGTIQCHQNKSWTDPNNPMYGPLGGAAYAGGCVREDAMLVDAAACINHVVYGGAHAGAQHVVVRWCEAGLWECYWRGGQTGAAPSAYLTTRAAPPTSTPLTADLMIYRYGADAEESPSAVAHALAYTAGWEDRSALVSIVGKFGTPATILAGQPSKYRLNEWGLYLGAGQV